MNEKELNLRVKEAARTGELEPAWEWLRTWADKSGRFADKWHALSVSATLALNEARLEDATQFVSDLIAMDPEDPFPRSLEGKIRLLQGNAKAAEAPLRAAVCLAERVDDPNIFRYTTDLCEALLEAGKLVECEDWALRGMESDALAGLDAQQYIRRLTLVGRLYRQMGRWDKAEATLRGGLRRLYGSREAVTYKQPLAVELAAVMNRTGVQENTLAVAR